MLTHYLKIALRNMRKYKNQTLISVIGLAVGFTCFALATLWIRYEMTYDSFHKNAKQMYVVYQPSSFSPSGYSNGTQLPLAAYLKETFPEIANAIALAPAFSGGWVTIGNVDYPALTIRADLSFLQMFDVKILEGSQEFLIPDSRKIAITQRKARQLFGSESPIGKTINNDEAEICAVVSDLSNHSNYAFDFISPLFPMDPSHSWNAIGGENAIIELVPGINMEAFINKMRYFYIHLNFTTLPFRKTSIGNDLETNFFLQFAAFCNCFK